MCLFEIDALCALIAAIFSFQLIDDFFSIEIFSRDWWLFRSCLSLSVGRENVMRDGIINTAGVSVMACL